MVFGRLLGLQNHLKSIENRKNVLQKIDIKNVGSWRPFFKKILDFRVHFGAKIHPKLILKLTIQCLFAFRKQASILIVFANVFSIVSKGPTLNPTAPSAIETHVGLLGR